MKMGAPVDFPMNQMVVVVVLLVVMATLKFVTPFNAVNVLVVILVAFLT